jgi:hypothetical protein
MNHNTTPERGNTFLELLVAMSASLVVIGGAALSVTMLRAESEKQTAEQIITLLEQASICAVRSQVPVEVKIERNLMSESSKGRSLYLPKQYDYTVRFGGPKNAIVFYPSGFSSAGTIAVQGDNNFCIVSQTISGARKLECSYVS